MNYAPETSIGRFFLRTGLKFGVLSFGYDGFSWFEDQLAKTGAYTVNLGDNAQSIAMRDVYRRLGVGDDQIVSVNRDTIPAYAGPPCILVMNGVFPKHSFPIPANITPVFVGFHAKADVINDNLDTFKRFEPVGCRDIATTRRMTAAGIRAFTTGCVTLTLAPREAAPPRTRLLIVYGSEFPASILRHIPRDLSDTAELIYHRHPVGLYPLTPERCSEIERYENSLLQRYRRDATLILTPLHHVATPCMAMGIPVIISRFANDDRFSFLETLMPIYTPERFAKIDWRPRPVDVSRVRSDLLSTIGSAIVSAISAS